MKQNVDLMPGLQKLSRSKGWKAKNFVLSVFVLLFACVNLNAQVTYHLGNSLTDTNNGMLPLISQSAGKNHTYLRTTIPGAPTDWVWDHPGGANGEPDYRTVFANRVLDHLFTQPFAGHCRSIANEAEYSGKFFTEGRRNNANVQHWLYMQWPSTSIDDCWSKGEGGVNGTAASNFIQAICNHRIYFEKVRELMDQQQPGKSIRIMPSGLALAKLKIEMDAGRVPGMTDINSLFSDGLHLNEKGQYLISLTLYAGIFAESPVGKVTYKPSGLTDQQASIFRQIAWDVVSDYPWSGLGGSGTLANQICSGGGGTDPNPPPPVTVSGNVEREVWTNIAGNSVTAIPLNTTPSSKTLLTSLEIPVNSGDNYGDRIRGYIVPGVEGWYNLYLAADDDAELWFSSGTNPADKAKVASVTGWTNSREWNKYPSQKSSQVYLVKGGKFYFEVLHKEGTGGDNLAVAWTGPNITTPTVIGSANLDKFVTETTSSNLALNKPTTTSSTESSSLTGAQAVDGSATTRWASSFTGDPQWIYVDLGSSHSINRVVLNWEAAFASGYSIQVSNDASNWTNIYTTTTGNGGIDDLTGLSGSGRYVRMLGTTRGTGYAYSLWEFEVYGSSNNNNTLTKATGTTFGTSPWVNCTTCTYDKAFDGNTSTYFDANDANGAYTGIDAGSARVITRIRYYPRTSNPERMVGGKFQGSNTSSSSGFVDLHTITAQPGISWQQVDISNTTGYRYLRYLAPTGGYGNVAEVEFYYGSSAARMSFDNEQELSQMSSQTLKAYPNPAKNLLTIDYTVSSDQPVQILLKNSLQQKVLGISRNAVKGKNSEVIDVHHLTQGVYFISIYKKNGNATRKVLIAK